MGLSLVHFNKSLASLRQEGYVRVQGRVITIVDRASLSTAVGFDETYLHMATFPKFVEHE